MNKRLRFYLKLIIVFCLLIALFIFIKNWNRHSIEFDNGYIWKGKSVYTLKEKNVYSTIINKKGETIIGPGGIELWAKYPWLYGDISTSQGLSYWAINMETNQSIANMNSNNFMKFMEHNSIDIGIKRVTLWTVSGGGMWQDKGRTQELKKACMPNKENKK